MLLKSISKFLFLGLFTFQILATPAQDKFLKSLKNIKSIKGNGDEKTLVLINKSSESLVKNWNEELAKEVCRVFNELLNVNENYFNLDLIEYVSKKKKKEFLPILNKSLSKKNRKVYKEMIKINERVNREGNG